MYNVTVAQQHKQWRLPLSPSFKIPAVAKSAQNHKTVKWQHFHVQHSNKVTVDTFCIGRSGVLFAPCALNRIDVSSTNKWIHSTVVKTAPKREQLVWAAWSGPILQRFFCTVLENFFQVTSHGYFFFFFFCKIIRKMALLLKRHRKVITKGKSQDFFQPGPRVRYERWREKLLQGVYNLQQSIKAALVALVESRPTTRQGLLARAGSFIVSPMS